MKEKQDLTAQLQFLAREKISALDILVGGSLAERVTSLVLGGEPENVSPGLGLRFKSLVNQIKALDVGTLKVVVLGGGTGLSNIIGGDSRQVDWKDNPFTGMKEFFPHLSSVVCVTDDGGSTGELLKDLPLIALGDLRHVLLASVRRDTLREKYNLDTVAAIQVTEALYSLFNYRFISCPVSAGQLLLDTGAILEHLPVEMRSCLTDLVEQLYEDPRLAVTLHRPQCLGNLLLASAIYRQLGPGLSVAQLITDHRAVHTATIRGLNSLAACIGVRKGSVLPCTTTLSKLQMLYGNGVLVTSEYKSGQARRGYPVDRVMVEFSRPPYLQPEVVQVVREADIILLAPGSLYTSIIPILQVPGLAESIRSNHTALKLLIANLWVQKGETDVARDAPDRKFYVSDLIRAYHRNIPGGVYELFSHVVSLDMSDIPGSILRRYALEEKEPIYLDRSKVGDLGFSSIEAPIFSKESLQRRGVIQHDPDSLAETVKTLWVLDQNRLLETANRVEALKEVTLSFNSSHLSRSVPSHRYEKICTFLRCQSTELITASSFLPEKMAEADRNRLLARVVEIIWLHPDILLKHLQYMRGITLIDKNCWKRSQEWDNVFSFYDPVDQNIKIRRDQADDINRFEVVFLVALGQSLLGNYAQSKKMVTIFSNENEVGRVYKLTVREQQHLDCFLDPEDIDNYLHLARMCASDNEERVYTRMVNKEEGFTPPGLLFGLFYAWYLDNQFAPNIEYKVSIMKNETSELIPEQVRLVARRMKTILFFRERIFRQQLPVTVQTIQ